MDISLRVLYDSAVRKKNDVHFLGYSHRFIAMGRE